ncbi:MAG: DUF2268 domain-containing protein [Muribaculaceae bacterium]|nr:DUF2268 domain-containing protein [Muribaculaceae bacterium]
MKRISFGIIILLVLVCDACKKHPKDNLTDMDRLHPIIRVDSYLINNQESSLPDSMSEVSDFIDYLVHRTVTGDSLSIEKYRTSASFSIFASDVSDRFTKQDSLEKVLGKIDSGLRKLSGDTLGLGKVYGLIIPYSVPVVTTDSAVIVGLNHYLGTDYPGYSGFDNYILRAKRPEHLPYDVAEGRIVASYPMISNENATLVNAMLYWGAVANLVEEIMPDADPKEIFNLDKEELEWLESNKENVWNAMIEKQLLYSSNPDFADRLLFPSPKSFIINQDAPGMTGRFMGYLIVKSYLKNNPGTSAFDMLNPSIYNSDQTLIKSGFTGK